MRINQTVIIKTSAKEIYKALTSARAQNVLAAAESVSRVVSLVSSR